MTGTCSRVGGIRYRERRCVLSRKIVTIIVCLCFCLVSAFAHPIAAKTSPNLYKVKKIYIAKQENMPPDVDSGVRLDRIMRAELAKHGFAVVDDRGKADAVLSGLVEEAGAVNGRVPDPPKYSYAYRLEAAAGGDLWSLKLSVSNRSKAVADQRGLEKIAAGLFKEWKRTAAQAGIKVGNKIP